MSDSYAGTLHSYSFTEPKLSCFEFGKVNKLDIVLFIGGLGDGYLSLPYLRGLSEMLLKLEWGLVQAHIRVSYSGYGVGSLNEDVEDLAQCVIFLRKKLNKKRIVLLGHSTGSQDCMQYLKSKNQLDPFSKINGAIAHCPVSDRDALSIKQLKFEEWIKLADSLVQQGQKDELMPRSAAELIFGAPFLHIDF